MKKILLLGLLVPIWLLMWCWEVKPTPEPTQPLENVVENNKKWWDKKQIETYYMWDDEAWFSLSTESWPIYLIPWFVKEETELKSSNRFEDDAVAWPYSKFLVVWFVISNDSKETITFSSYDILDVYDSEWRKFETSPEYTSDFYVPTAISFLDVRPWIPTQWWVVYEVPKNSEWFYMQAWDTKIILHERSIE